MIRKSEVYFFIKKLGNKYYLAWGSFVWYLKHKEKSIYFIGAHRSDKISKNWSRLALNTKKSEGSLNVDWYEVYNNHEQWSAVEEKELMLLLC